MSAEHNEQLFYHKTVMVDEVLQYLNPQPGATYCDVTFGSGGHTKAILDSQPECHVVAIDWDATSIETYAPELEEKYQERLRIIWGNFANIYRLLQKAKIGKVDGILADFGTSQMHIKERAGFSFYRDSDLDMRMSPAHQQTTAEHIVNRASAEKLCEIFWQLGQETHAKQIVAAIIEARQRKPIRTTRELALIVEKTIGRGGSKKGSSKIHPATKVFQALRMYVNQELNNITGFLAGALQLLKPNGLLLCISFHSLEDRLVKQFFKDKADEGILEIITKRVIVPTTEEIGRNPSSRSAKLRVARLLVAKPCVLRPVLR
jgi:16S rRNA (cytosine1402-N4)-methyltransferase